MDSRRVFVRGAWLSNAGDSAKLPAVRPTHEPPDHRRLSVDPVGIAPDRGGACLIIRLDTSGGLLESTQQIVQAFYASPVPVVVYVVPSQGILTGGGIVALALGAIDAAEGTVFIEGEIRRAVCEGSIAKDESVEVTAVDGLRLRVRRCN